MSVRGNRRRRALALVYWLLFAAGLLVELFSPRLKISNRAFVIPPQMAAGKNPIRLEEIVGGQRRTQVLSALLTLSGVLGLAFVYRDILVQRPAGRDSTRSQHPPQKTLDEETHSEKPTQRNYQKTTQTNNTQ